MLSGLLQRGAVEEEPVDRLVEKRVVPAKLIGIKRRRVRWHDDRRAQERGEAEVGGDACFVSPPGGQADSSPAEKPVLGLAELRPAGASPPHSHGVLARGNVALLVGVPTIPCP
jgi:hypothetical protein